MKESGPVSLLGLTKAIVTETDTMGGQDCHSPVSQQMIRGYELDDQQALLSRGSRRALPRIAHNINVQEKPTVEDKDATSRRLNAENSQVAASRVTVLASFILSGFFVGDWDWLGK